MKGVVRSASRSDQLDDPVGALPINAGPPERGLGSYPGTGGFNSLSEQSVVSPTAPVR